MKSLCVDKVVWTDWLKQYGVRKDSNEIINNLFPSRKYLGKIFYSFYEKFKKKESFQEWLDDLLLNYNKTTKYSKVNPNNLLNQLTLRLNIIIKIFYIENVGVVSSYCTNPKHSKHCCLIKLDYVSSLVNLQKKDQEKDTFCYIVNQNQNSVHETIQELSDSFNIFQTDLPTYSEIELKDYIKKKFILTTVPEFNYRKNIFEAPVYVKIFLADNFVNSTSLKKNNHINFYSQWGSKTKKEPGIAIIILGGESSLKFVKVPLCSVREISNHASYFSNLKSIDSIDNKNSRLPFSEENCPCDRMPFYLNKKNIKYISKPVGITETLNDFTHTLQLLSMYNTKEQILIQACCRLSISSFDIERYVHLKKKQ